MTGAEIVKKMQEEGWKVLEIISEPCAVITRDGTPGTTTIVKFADLNKLYEGGETLEKHFLKEKEVSLSLEALSEEKTGIIFEDSLLVSEEDFPIR